MKRWAKITLYVFGLLMVLLGCLILYAYYWTNHKYLPQNGVFKERVAFIDLNKAQLTKGFTICDSTYIVDYYNYAHGDSVHRRTTYIHGKNGLRKEVMASYRNKNYTDSGYLNFRFIVNCKGDAGAYVIHQNDLDLHPTTLDPDMVEQLFTITTSLKKWLPNYMRGSERDSYMYISYRIENGEIVEILP